MSTFHGNLNRMALFTAIILCVIVFFYRTFFEIATANIYLNGIIIGTTLFGMVLCFIKMFALLPEHRWLYAYTNGVRHKVKQPKLLNSIALMLRARPNQLTEHGLHSILDAVMVRFEDDRESVRYITNTLIFLGLLGTFWGLILTVGGFAELIGNLNFNDEAVLETMQSGLTRPLGGMATAFTSSLLGLGGSLIVGFLALQLNMAQGSILRELEDYLSSRTIIARPETNILPRIESNLDKITNYIQHLDNTVQNAYNPEF